MTQPPPNPQHFPQQPFNGPPPFGGQQPPPQYAPGPAGPSGYPAGPPPQVAKHPGATTIGLLGLISLVAVVAGLSIKEDGRYAWSSVHAWGALPILGALLVLAPAAGHAIGLSPARAVRSAYLGAGALAVYWVLFVLGDVGSNTSLAVTVGVAAGLFAAWFAAGRPSGTGPGAPHQW